MTKKMTKREMFEKVLGFSETQANPEIVEGIKHEIELLDRKNKSPKKPTQNQVENEAIKEAILEEMRANPNKIYKATELGKIVEEKLDIKPLTPQRISPIMKKMWEEGGTGEVKRITDKRVTAYQIA